MFLLVLAALIILGAVAAVNSIRRKEVKVAESLSGVDVALTKRYDVMKKLLEASQGYLAYEQSVLLDTVKIRQGMSLTEIVQAESQMDALSEQILAKAEQYPALSSSAVFQQLQIGIADTEQHLESARRVYNSNVRLYNTAIAQFPGNLLAKGKQPAEFFKAKSGTHVDMKITF